jgi:hypothetical protein
VEDNFKFMLDSPETDFYLTCTFLDPKYKSFAFLQDQALIDQHHAKVWDYLKANFDQPEKLSELEKEFNEYKGLQLETLLISTFYQQNEAKFPLLSAFAKNMLLVVANPIRNRFFFTEEIQIDQSCQDDIILMDKWIFLSENEEFIWSREKGFKIKPDKDLDRGDHEDREDEDYEDYEDEDYEDEDSEGEDYAEMDHADMDIGF